MVSFMLWPLYLKGGGFGTHWIGDCVGPRAGLDILVKDIILTLPLPGIEPWLSCP